MSGIIQEETKKILDSIDFKTLRNKKILVTGASGLIGVFVISTLNEIMDSNNLEVYAFTRYVIDPVISNLFDNCHTINGDLIDIDRLIHPTIKYDIIIHAAGYGQPNKFMNDKVKTIELNTSVTIKLLEKLAPNGKFLFVSSSELYSGLDYDNITEEQIGITNTNHPRSCYIEGKRCGEAICYANIANGVDIKIIRLSLAYGPGGRKGDTRVLNSLIQKGIDNDEIKLMDGGDAIRTYCYITDVIEMFWNILLFGKDTLYNVGGNSKLSIFELGVLIGDFMGKSVIKNETSQGLIGNPKLVNISTEKYLNEFPKTNFVSINEGIKKTIEWQKQL